MLGYAKVYFHLPYRQTKEGIVKGHTKGKLLSSIPDFSKINKRINRLNIKINNKSKQSEEEECYDHIIIAIDSTGIKVTNRGQWMNKKWNVRRKKKGYLKIHVAVDIKRPRKFYPWR